VEQFIISEETKINCIHQDKIMNDQPENLTSAEQKMAYIMGFDVEGPSLVERLITYWHIFRAYRHIRANKIPMQVFLRNIAEPEQAKSQI
jgi:hypothetical protein